MQKMYHLLVRQRTVNVNQSRKIKKLFSATGGPLISFGKALLNRHRGPVDLDGKSPVLNTNERETFPS